MSHSEQSAYKEIEADMVSDDVRTPAENLQAIVDRYENFRDDMERKDRYVIDMERKDGRYVIDWNRKHNQYKAMHQFSDYLPYEVGQGVPTSLRLVFIRARDRCITIAIMRDAERMRKQAKFNDMCIRILKPYGLVNDETYGNRVEYTIKAPVPIIGVGGVYWKWVGE